MDSSTVRYSIQPKWVSERVCRGEGKGSGKGGRTGEGEVDGEHGHFSTDWVDEGHFTDVGVFCSAEHLFIFLTRVSTPFLSWLVKRRRTLIAHFYLGRGKGKRA